MIEHEAGELELVTEQRRRLAIGNALAELVRAAGRTPGEFAYAEGGDRIAVVRRRGDRCELLIALPHAEPGPRW